MKFHVALGAFALLMILLVLAFLVFGPKDGPPAAVVADGELPGMPVQGEPVKTPSGLEYYDLVVGTGASPTPANQVKLDYSGYLKDGTKFDSSYDRGMPLEGPADGFVPGFNEGLKTMKVGGTRKLIIPGNLGYGPNPRPGSKIPPNATLIFDIELREVN